MADTSDRFDPGLTSTVALVSKSGVTPNGIYCSKTKESDRGSVTVEESLKPGRKAIPKDNETTALKRKSYLFKSLSLLYNDYCTVTVPVASRMAPGGETHGVEVALKSPLDPPPRSKLSGTPPEEPNTNETKQRPKHPNRWLRIPGW